MLCLWVVQDGEDFDRADEVLELLVVLCLLVLESQLVDLPEAEGLLIDHLYNLLADLLHAVCAALVDLFPAAAFVQLGLLDALGTSIIDQLD